MGKFDRCYLCNDIDLGDGQPSIRLLGHDMVCTNCVPELPSPEGDAKQEGEVDTLDVDDPNWYEKTEEYYNKHDLDNDWLDDE